MLATINTVKLDKVPKLEGRLPEKLLFSRYNDCKLVILLKELGIRPPRLLLDTPNSIRLARLPSSEGSDPVK